MKRQSHLIDGLGVSMDDLRRRCERRQPARSAACALFWTLGGNQVGKGALAGWRMLQEEPSGSIRIWPFVGELERLFGDGKTVVVETDPTEFYGHLGLPRVVRKRKQGSRLGVALQLLQAADRFDVRLHPELHHQVMSGCGPAAAGEDAFDAVVGLLGMINVISGVRPPGEPRDDVPVILVEGWILGQDAI